MEPDEVTLTSGILLAFGFGWAKPLIVVTAGDGHNAEWMAAQDRLATLSTNSEHCVVADATHESLLLVRTDAAAATKASRDVVTSVRTASPLN